MPIVSNLENMLWMLRDGKVDFGAFVVATRGEYRALARSLLRRWPSPEWFTAEDLEQELYLGTWRQVWGYAGADGGFVDFDPSRGVAFSRWIVFGAMCGAKRALHKARGVTISGSPDRKVSQLETPASLLGEEGVALLDSILAQPAEAEAEIIRVQETRRAATRALRVCETSKERYAVLAIREAGSLDGAGRVLYDDVEHRTTLRLGCESAAERFVSKHAGQVARRIDDGVNPG